jgi:phospholipase C
MPPRPATRPVTSPRPRSARRNLPALTFRDANANDLTDFLDLDALADRRPTFRTLPRLAAPGNTPAALACSVNGPGVIPPPGSISG